MSIHIMEFVPEKVYRATVIENFIPDMYNILRKKSRRKYRIPLTAPFVTQDEPDYNPEDGNAKEPVPYISKIRKGCLIGFK